MDARARRRERDRLRKQAQRAQRKAWAFAALGNACARCGETTCLQFHHVYRASKRDVLMRLYSHSWEVFKWEVEACELLCVDCHLHAHSRAGRTLPPDLESPPF